MLSAYLILCVVIFILLVLWGTFEDLTKGPDLKFGYNYANRFYWLIILLLSCPFVNIVVVSLFCYVHYAGPRIRRKRYD